MDEHENETNENTNETTNGTPTIRPGTPADVDACVAVWVAAGAHRDGRRVPGVAERARAKFDKVAAWLIAERSDGTVAAFALATTPGSGNPTDPPDAVVLGLLAVAPEDQGSGLGRRLVSDITSVLSAAGFQQAVLHALIDNSAAVRLYEDTGWVAYQPPFEHSLLKRPMQTYLRALR